MGKEQQKRPAPNRESLGKRARNPGASNAFLSSSASGGPHHANPAPSGGFTLLELLVVVAIIGVLAAYVGPKYFGQVGKSEQALAKAQIDGFHKALGAYRLDVGSFPSTEDGLNSLFAKPATAAKWGGPYLSKAVPPDPWGKPYIYRSPGSKGDYELLSYGKDGQPGGTGDAADAGE